MQRETIRKVTIFVPAAFFAVLGVLIDVVSVFSGDPVQACVGMAILVGAGTAAWALQAEARLKHVITVLAAGLDDVRRRLTPGVRACTWFADPVVQTCLCDAGAIQYTRVNAAPG